LWGQILNNNINKRASYTALRNYSFLAVLTPVSLQNRKVEGLNTTKPTSGVTSDLILKPTFSASGIILAGRTDQQKHFQGMRECTRVCRKRITMVHGIIRNG
jgi:hypothetical protein